MGELLLKQLKGMKMNSIGRVLGIIEGKKIDRLPFTLLLSLYGAKLLNISTKKYFSDSELYIRGQEKIINYIDPDIIFSPFGIALFAKAFGCEVNFFDNFPPILKKPVLDKNSLLSDLKIPPFENDIIKFFLNSTKGIVEDFGNQKPIAAIMLPNTDLPALIYGIDDWLKILLFEHEKTLDILQKLQDFLLEYVKEIKNAGVSFIVMPTLFCNPQIISENLAKKLIFPIFSAFLSEIEIPIIIHHGGAKIMPFLKLLKDLPNITGFVLAPGEDFSEARKIIGKNKILLGNLNGPALTFWKKSDIINSCDKVYSERMKAKDDKFIFASSNADINYDTPLDNLLTIRKFFEENSYYDEKV